MDELEVMDVIGIVDLWMRKPRRFLGIFSLLSKNALGLSQLTCVFS